MPIFLQIIIVCIITVIPTLLLAHLMKAPRADFWAGIVAVVMTIGTVFLLNEVVANRLFFWGLSVGVGSVIFSLTLGVSLLRGFVVSVVSLVVHSMAIIGLGLWALS